MNCPHCSVPLVMAERGGIEIDHCPTCRGVWLDRGELDKIIERGAAEVAPAPVRQPAPGRQPGYDPYQGPGHDPHYRHHKRRKSFLEELFD